MVKNIVEAYDGDISFTTELNRGTVFTVIIPKK
jgi:signal transduction histidine kinase